ncbi:hypothetical protein GQ600_7816 [Phytophthora cactorum]|nr:hypothetical protein GQ600_7816 [Phytophthora cactorum]
MIRKRGYSLKGKTVAIRGDFQRKPRGTFDRVEFVQCCRDFRTLPEGGSAISRVKLVWILDGASIHRHPEIIHFLRSIGYMFGYVKNLSSGTMWSLVGEICCHLLSKPSGALSRSIWGRCLSTVAG